MRPIMLLLQDTKQHLDSVKFGHNNNCFERFNARHSIAQHSTAHRVCCMEFPKYCYSEGDINRQQMLRAFLPARVQTYCKDTAVPLAAAPTGS